MWTVVSTFVASAFSAICVVIAMTWYFADQANDIKAVKSTVDRMQTDAAERVLRTDNNIKLINDTIKDLPYRQGQSEEAQKNANIRMDRIVDSLGTKIDKVLENQNKTDTKVEVTTSKVDSVAEQVDDLRKSIAAQRTSWKEAGVPHPDRIIP